MEGEPRPRRRVWCKFLFLIPSHHLTTVPDAEQIRFLADPSGEFTKSLDLLFDSKAIFGNDRSKRYALIIEDGKVTKIAVEPDNTGTAVSLADQVLA